MKKWNIIIAILLVFMIGGIFYATKDYPKVIEGALGPGVWPRFLAILMAFLAILLLIGTFIPKSNDESEKEPVKFNSGGVKRVFAITGTLVLFVFMLQTLGLLISSFIFIVLVMLVMGERRIKWLLGTSFGITFGIWIVFELLLKLMLPRPIFL
jgi:putative tricarboxylic transport membrane protein